MFRASGYKKLLCLTLAFVATTVYAAVTQVGPGAFSPGATVVNFDDYTTGQPAIAEFSISGAGSWSVQDGGAWGGSADPGRQTFTIGGPIELTFNSRVTRVGFVFGGNTPNDVPFETRRDGVATGNFTLESADAPPDGTTNWYFVGYEDPQGIDSIWFDEEQTEAWVYGIYDLTLDESTISAPTAIPATSSWSIALAIVLFMLIAFELYRRETI
jgi:hypothetical protein